MYLRILAGLFGIFFISACTLTGAPRSTSELASPPQTVTTNQASSTQPSWTQGTQVPADEVVSALDTPRLLEIGYRRGVATVEGMIVKAYWASSTNGKPTFLDFHDPYEGYFTALIWGSERSRFPKSPEVSYLNKKVRVKGTIEVYKGVPEIILREASQIWIVK